MIGDDLDKRLSDLEERAGVSESGGPTIVVTNGCPSAEYMVEYEPGDDDPIERHAKPALPNIWPPRYLSRTVVVLTSDEIAELWDNMPKDIREREREYRQENDLLIPAVLED